LVAELPGSGVVGMVSVWESESFIHHLYIDARYRRRGLGALLLQSLNGRWPKPYQLKCLVSNSRGLAFYRRLGWKEIATEEGPDGASILLELH
jgi:ribosomal protein S18 acetylase RimI-like enzyme